MSSRPEDQQLAPADHAVVVSADMPDEDYETIRDARVSEESVALNVMLDNPPMDAATGMQPSLRERPKQEAPKTEMSKKGLENVASPGKTVAEALAPPVPHDFDWEPHRAR